ncbi:MAG: hypothetical protein OXF89_10480 [Rhodospirillaceae bacterium]|nr:hypothetical protein [Rhodospirillaceae bacterium]MCY4066958.1 hypothetical protein [Rhodospirillaceae bacterium]
MPLAATGLAAGLPGAAQAQEALTPAQKAERVFHTYGRYGAKYSYGPVAEENGVLTVRNLKYAVTLPGAAVDKPGAPKKSATMTLTVETIAVRRYDYRNPELPHFADMTFTGVRIGGSLLDTAEMRSVLALFGGHDPVIDLLQTYELDREAGSIDLTAGTATLRGFMRFDLAGRFDGVEFARLTDPKLLEKLGPGSAASMPPEAALNVVLDLFAATRVHRLSYALTDLGGVDKMLAVMAAAQTKQNPDGPKITAEMLRQGFAGGLAGMAARFSGSFAPAMLGAAARWMQAPGTLTIALKPGRPLPFTGIVGYIGAFAEQAKQAKGQKLDLDPLQKFLGLSLTYTPAAR